MCLWELVLSTQLPLSIQLITPLFKANNGMEEEDEEEEEEKRGGGGLWYKSELHVGPHFFSRKLGTLKRASGFKRYSLSFLMERSRNAPTWSRGSLDLYISALPGEGREGGREGGRETDRRRQSVCPHLRATNTSTHISPKSPYFLGRVGCPT